MSTYDHDRTEIITDLVRISSVGSFKEILKRHRARLTKTEIYWDKARVYSKVIGRLLCLNREIKTFGSSRHRELPILPLIKHSKLDTKCLLHPKSSFKTLWNILIMFLLVYTATVFPYRLCFNRLQSSEWALADTTIDLIFLTDVFINFNTALISISERIIYSRKAIAKNYIKTWFFIDFFSSIPMDFILSSNGSSSGYNRFLRIFRVSRIYRIIKILRLLKLIRFLRTEYQSSIAIKNKFDSTFTRVLGFIVSLAVIVHISGCIWYYLSSVDDDQVHSWVFRYSIDDRSDLDVYVSSIYFVFTTLTTVGYGDITPFTNMEKCFTIILMGFGVGFYSYMIGSLTSSLKSSDSVSMKVKSKYQGFKEFSKAINLSPEISDRVKNYIKMNTHKFYTENVHIDLIFRDLPSCIREQIMNHVNLGISKLIDYFDNKPTNFVNSIISHLQLCTYVYKEILYEEFDTPEEVYFIKSGRVLLKIHGDLVFRIFVQGSYFGEIEIFEETSRKSSAEVGSKTAEIYTLQKGDFLKVLKSFSDIYETTKNVAKIRKAKNEEAISEALNDARDSSYSLKTDSLESSSEEEVEKFSKTPQVALNSMRNKGFTLRRNDTGMFISMQNDTPFKQKNRKLWENAIVGRPMRFGRSVNNRSLPSKRRSNVRNASVEFKSQKSYTNPVKVKRSIIRKPTYVPSVNSMEAFEEFDFDAGGSPEKKVEDKNSWVSGSDSLLNGLSKRQDKIELQLHNGYEMFERMSQTNRVLSTLLIKMDEKQRLL